MRRYPGAPPLSITGSHAPDLDARGFLVKETKRTAPAFRMPSHPSEDSAERGARSPEAAGAMQHSVLSLQKPRAHHGELFGWIVRIQG